jgi:ABC-type dipeptide/oligopeptide/nickel transport system permease component
MLRYTVERILLIPPTLLAMSLVIFAVMHATPGSPLQPEGANPLSPAEQANLAQAWGLDRPLWEQYLIFLSKAVRLDFGVSYNYRTTPVTEIIARTFPVSLHLGTMAMLLAVVAGMALGILAAVNQNGPVDYACTFTAMLGVATPNFVLAVLLIIGFVMAIPLIPRTGGWASPVDWILPTVALAMAPLGTIARYTRSSMIDVIRADYVRTARAKGLDERRVMVGHVLKNALIPPVTILGPLFAALGTGSFFVEYIFRVPGMGRFFVQSLVARDYPMIMAVFLLYGAFLTLMTLAMDVVYAVLDPRIRFE